ncbi:MAG: hypothetical protein DRJ98_05325 [Thermoprotei archaeon]|nr:MAG: hypothetical protein DRJ98_05325 [Thermoprotei archaeon]
MDTRLQLFKEAFIKRHEKGRELKAKGKRLLGWICTYVPEELIMAAGAIPVRVTGPLGDTPRANSYLPSNTCSTMRSCLDAALAKTYDYLEGVVFSNSCDNMGRCFDIWRNHSGYSYLHFFNTPHSRSKNAFRLYLYELERFKVSLEALLNVNITDEAIRNAIRLLNEERELLTKLYELRAENPPPLTGTDAFFVVASAMTLPKEESIELLRKLLEEPPKPLQDLKDRPRILVSCSFIDDEAKLVNLIEESGGVVVVDDSCCGMRYFKDIVEEAKPSLQAIAERYLNKVPCPFMEHYEDRFKHVKDLIKRYNVQGVIYYCVKFCDVHLFDAPMLMEELREMGIPCIFLDWSHTELDWSPLKTRVEAFIESLR